MGEEVIYYSSDIVRCVLLYKIEIFDFTPYRIKLLYEIEGLSRREDNIYFKCHHCQVMCFANLKSDKVRTLENGRYIYRNWMDLPYCHYIDKLTLIKHIKRACDCKHQVKEIISEYKFFKFHYQSLFL
ncbi:TPA_asm: hypothetical protein [Anelosimus tangle-web spider MELD virus]|nr:TPA_asm: hypothetical protein [Anelosimus tangle-web spider MELD virus]